MADVTVTRQNVQIMSALTKYKPVQYGEAVTQAQTIYLKSDGKWYLADCDGASAEIAMSNGGAIALTPGATNEYGIAVASGPMDVGGTLVVGETYYLSDTPGGIKPHADLDPADRVVILGVATAADTLNVDISYTGATVP